MNKRICELKEAAMEVTFSSPSTGREQKQLNVDKFAELIVRECMSLMKEEKDYYDNPSTYETEKYYIRMDAKAEAFDDASSIIKNHFGVEE